jgi:hypothetical protein
LVLQEVEVADLALQTQRWSHADEDVTEERLASPLHVGEREQPLPFAPPETSWSRSATPRTLLHLLRALPVPAPGELRVVGDDEFAVRHGHTYAIVLRRQRRRVVTRLSVPIRPSLIGR